MLIKLIKYDLRADYAKYTIIVAAMVLLSVTVRVLDVNFGAFDLDNIADGMNGWRILTILASTLLLMMCGFSLLLTVIFSAVRYQKKIYTDEGYLMNTLPVHPALHIASSVITNYIWTIVVAATDILATVIAAGGFSFWKGFFAPFELMFNINSSYAFFCFVNVALLPLYAMLTLVFSINFGYLFRKHRVLGGLLGYILLCLCSNLISYIYFLPMGTTPAKYSSSVAQIFYENPDYVSSPDQFENVMSSVSEISSAYISSSFICSAVLTVLMIGFSVYLLKKKINLD